MLAALTLVASAMAQEFLFVSNRLRAEPEVGASGATLYQNELYLYRDGSEIRLTVTPDQNEWDPALSPSGRHVAYMVNDTVIDWAADELPETWNWYLRIMDLESGMLLEEWLVPEAAGTTRMAGGFGIAWYADEQSLLVQVLDQAHEGSIALFEVGVAEPRILARGVGASLDAATGWFATTMDGYVTVVDPSSGASYPLVMGEVLGWLGDQVVVGGQGPLMLFDPVSATRTELATAGDYYTSFAISPDGSHYAWLHYLTSGTVITVADSEFEPLAEWLYPDYVASVSWLDDDVLLLSTMMQDRLVISEMRISDGAEYVLVSSFNDSFLPELKPESDR